MSEHAAEPSETAELEICLKVLRRLERDPQTCAAPASLAHEIGKQAARLMRSLKAQEKAERRKRDLDVVESAGIRQRRQHRADSPPKALPFAEDDSHEPAVRDMALSAARKCYICKAPYREVHRFYDLMCPACGDANFARRSQTANLSGYTSLVTGGRIKIGFQIALKLLRAGSKVLITTRFPNDAALRFSREADFPDWRDRLEIYAADFRFLPLVEALAREISANVDRLDVLINNAAQTVRRPPAFYRHLLETEAQSRAELPKLAQSLIAGDAPQSTPQAAGLAKFEAGDRLSPAAMSQLAVLPGDALSNPEEFPPGQFDGEGQQVDQRAFNSWVQRLVDVSPGELVEVHAVNCLAPYILIAGLESLFAKPPARDRFIVNVSAMEGKFHAKKTGFHPHTNMAKAALNMLTRTASARYARQRIYMNSVDTGWITNEFPLQKTQQMAESGFQPPLDEIDGAARVCAPIFDGVQTGEPAFGKFYKDYREVSW